MTDELTGKIIGAAIEVHKTLGAGLLESVYEEALCYEFTLRGIKFERQISVDILYKGHPITGQRLDLLVEGEVVVELKSLPIVPEVAVSQVISYLSATGLKRGLIINFGKSVLIDGIRRISL